MKFVCGVEYSRYRKVPDASYMPQDCMSDSTCPGRPLSHSSHGGVIAMSACRAEPSQAVCGVVCSVLQSLSCAHLLHSVSGKHLLVGQWAHATVGKR